MVGELRIGVAAVTVGILVALVVALRAHDTSALNRRTCERIDRLDRVIVSALHRQQKILPANDFFRAHPDARAAAQQELRREIRDFAEVAC